MIPPPFNPRRAVLLTLAGLAAAAPTLAAQDATAPVSAALSRSPAGDHFEAVLLPSGDTLRYTIYVPTGLEGGRSVPLVLALHPGSMAHPWIGGAYMHQLVKPALEGTGAVIVAPDALAVPEAPFRTESFTSARNLDALLWLRRTLLETYPIDPTKVVITGYSRGGQGVWHMAERHPQLFSVGIAVSARAGFESVEGVKLPVYMIHSIDDEVIGAILVQGAFQQLQEGGADVAIKVIRGATHYQTEAFVEPLRDVIPWLEETWRRRGEGR